MARKVAQQIITEKVKVVPKYTKGQILGSARFANRRDLVDALLDEDKKYTMETVDTVIEEFMKGKVK